jgi:hypothetical protein
MGIFNSISFFLKKKEKYHYSPRVIEKVILPAFFDGRKIDDVSRNDVDETNLDDYELFNFGENFVLYFETKISEESDSYIRKNYTLLREQFYNKGRDFFYLPILLENIDFEIFPALKSSFPFLSDDLNNSIIEELKTAKFDYDSILYDFTQFIRYKGTILKGCISQNIGYTIVEQNNEESIEKFFEGYIENLSFKNTISGVRFYSLKENSEKSEEEEKQILESLNTINNEIERLRQSGQLAILAPKIYEFLKKNMEGIIYNDTHSMVITEDYKILIPECNNLEIKLSHFTKAIYILFLSNPEPIDLKDLHLHKDRLLLIYKQVSNQNSYDKIKESVEELLREENEAIYVHFSRIRKAFLTHFSQYIAFRYYITGDKGKPKKIMFDRKNVTLNCNLF